MAERPEAARRYAAAGVDLAAADEAVDRVKAHVRSTFRPEVLSDIGGFGGLVAVPAGYTEPVLVSSTDGVGTKLKVAELAGRFDTIGIDLVAMCVDDIAVQGADPLFFLDYVGVGRLDPVVVEEIVAGVAEGCRQAGCALVGGEIAEHGAGHSLDLAGFAVGVVERAGVLTGAAIAAGDVIVGLLSPGLRSNGYSLARQVLLPRKELLDDPAWEGASLSLADELLRPSVIYSPAMAALRRSVDVHGFAHVTGGGLPGNLARVLPPAVDAIVKQGSWPVPRLFREVQRRGEVSDAEMAQVFNLGLGMVAVVAPADASATVACLQSEGIDAVVVGGIMPGAGRVRLS
jgi:phosphoribosylformylglycinamidine cyclo-ligase